jgi:DNA-binding CsgD family transcriptional regulator
MIHGREGELDRIGRLITDARAGRGGALVIRGEAGIGKTALLREGAALAGPATVLTVAGVESEVELAFSGLHQLLTPVLEHLAELADAQRDALSGALGLDAGQSTDLLVYTAVLNLLRRAARSRPLVVAVDDAQHLDHASMLALLFVARRIADCCVAVLLAVRDPDRRPVDTSDLPGVRLAGLGVDASAGLLRSRGRAVDDATVAMLVRATGGNPLALSELGGERVILDALVTGTVPVGVALREAFAGRTSTLPEQSGAALLIAAAEDTGRCSVVYAACRTQGLPAGALDAAERAGLVTVDGDELRFAHPLVRSAVYSAASSQQRRLAHAAIAGVLDRLGSAARARWHRALATLGPADTLADALERDAGGAADRGGAAATVSALREAARLSSAASQRRRRLAAAAHAAWKSGRALVARSLAEQAECSPAGAADAATVLVLIRLRGLIELYGGDQAIAYEHLVRGAESLSRTSPEQAAELLFMAADAAIHLGRVDDAYAAAERVADLEVDAGYRQYGRWLAASVTDSLDATGPGAWQVFAAAPAAIQRSGAHRWLLPMAISARSRDSLQAHTFGLAAYEQIRRQGMVAITAIGLSWLVDLERRLGRWADGIVHAEEGLRAARDTGQQQLTVDFLSQLALFAAGRGDEGECRRYANLALQTSLPLRNRLAAAQATWALGVMHLARGEYELASEQLVKIGTPGMPTAHEQIARAAAADTVEAHVKAGNLEQATLLVDEFERWLRPNSPPWSQAHRYRCRALLSYDTSVADKEFQLALAVPQSEDRPFEQARTALLYGQWLRRNRRTREARVPLRLGAALFDTLGAAPWAERAMDELRVCGAPATRSLARTEDLLTPQELAVAKLAASGLTNRQIGAHLFLSHRTVGYHLHKIFLRLGISHRSQLRGLGINNSASGV